MNLKSDAGKNSKLFKNINKSASYSGRYRYFHEILLTSSLLILLITIQITGGLAFLLKALERWGCWLTLWCR